MKLANLKMADLGDDNCQPRYSKACMHGPSGGAQQP
jgi:hypothetical protein